MIASSMQQIPIGGLLCLFLLIATCTGNECSPCICTHTEHGVAANCSARALTKVPRGLPHTLFELNLHDNHITEIISSDFSSYNGLKRLHLSKNDLKRLNQGPFTTLSNLEFLGLSCNGLSYDTTSLPADTFAGLSKLRVLAIHGNNWMDQSNYRDDLFNSVTGLEELYMDGLPEGIDFGDGFKALTTLTKLYIYGGFDYISSTTFEVFKESNVRVLHINSGRLYDTETLAFSHFPCLTTLSVSGNTRLGLQNVSKSFRGLQSTTVKDLYLQDLVPETREELTSLNESFYRDLMSLNIESLRLDANKIGAITPSHLNGLPHLRRISLNCNHIHQFTDLMNTSLHLHNISFTVIAFENSFSNRKECFYYTKYFPDSPLFYGDICFVNTSWSSTASQGMYESPSIRAQGSSDGSDMCRILPSPASLETIIIKGAIAHPFSLKSPFCLLGAKSLQHIEYSHMHLEAMRVPIYIIPPSAVHGIKFIGNSNGMKYIDPELLSYSINNYGLIVKRVDLYDNKLGMQLAHGTFLGYLKDLEDLNLGENGIKILKREVFINLTMLERLSLSHNSLSEINFEILQMKRLKYFNLAHNLFASFDKITIKRMNALMQNVESFTLDLSHNPLVCSCDTIQFLNWPVLKTISRGKQDAYRCYYMGERIGLETFYDKHFLALQKQCSSQEYLKISGGLIALMIVSGAISLCIHRHRWDVKFFCLKLVSKRKQEQHYEESRAHYEYDAFVAFHQNDLNWVRHCLMSNLEGQNQVATGNDTNGPKTAFRLCVHHRDFLPGIPIEENIVNAINNSRKVILVLSRDFVTSGWCDFELQMARMRCFDEGQDLIIVVMLESVPAQSMTGTLRNLIRRNTYIEWHEKEEDKREFWIKLKRILSSRDNRHFMCDCRERPF